MLPVAATTLISLLIAGWVAGSVWPKLIESSPLTLLILSPANRFLLLVTNSLDAWSYYTVGLIRHMIPDPAFFALGWWYGRRAIKWAAEDNPGVERMFGPDGSALGKPGARKLLAVFAILTPNNWVSLACGAARLPFGLFLGLNVVGTGLRLFLCRLIGQAFETEIRDFADWVGKYQNWVLMFSVATVLVLMWFQGRRAAREISGLMHLADEE